MLLVLSAAAVSADYLLVTQYGAANCAGSPTISNAQQLGCQSSGSGFFSSVTCINSTWGVVNAYNSASNPNAASCTGAVASTNIISGFPWGCTSSGSQSSKGACVTGTWAAPANSVSITNFPNTAACPPPAAASASSALSYSAGTCIPFGSTASGATSLKASCTSSSYTTTQFTTADCSGAGSTLATGSLGCTQNTPSSGQQGVSVAQCTSGASSASIAFASIALMLVAAASASAL